MYNGFNLISLSAKDSTKFALRVASHIFTNQELAENGVLDHSRHTSRNQLDSERVDLIKGKII